MISKCNQFEDAGLCYWEEQNDLSELVAQLSRALTSGMCRAERPKLDPQPTRYFLSVLLIKKSRDNETQFSFVSDRGA